MKICICDLWERSWRRRRRWWLWWWWLQLRHSVIQYFISKPRHTVWLPTDQRRTQEYFSGASTNYFEDKGRENWDLGAVVHSIRKWMEPVFWLDCYELILQGTGNSAQIWQNFGLSGGLNPPNPTLRYITATDSNAVCFMLCLLLLLYFRIRLFV
jgi:hypothetical protein